MKTLVLFHRLELTEMFSAMSVHLQNSFNLIHVAYSDVEVKLLKNSAIVGDIICFKDEISKLLAEGIPVKSTMLEMLDSEILKSTKGNFNLNGALQSDRGFSALDYDESLKLTLAYATFWEELILSSSVDFVMHEDITLMMNFICAIKCDKHGAKYVYQLMEPRLPGDQCYLTLYGCEFICSELESNHSLYVSGSKSVNHDEVDSFLIKFRSSFDIYLDGIIKSRTSPLVLLAGALYHQLTYKIRQIRFDKLVDNIDLWHVSCNKYLVRYRNLRRYANEVTFSKFDDTVPYYFYPLHLEPESVVLYFGGGMYQNQVKLIQNIAAQLPPGDILYVKDHPHDFGYRSADDYIALTNVPNIRLLEHNFPGKAVIKSAKGVFTINGTSGFEAVILGKPAFIFGNAFYRNCPGVFQIQHVRNLRELLYSINSNYVADEDGLVKFVASYLDSLSPGVVDYFAGRASSYGVDLDDNVKMIADDFTRQMNF